MNTALWWLVQNTVTVAIAIPLVALACRVFRHRPAVQHALWLILLIKLMTPPLAVWPWSVNDVQEALWSTDSVNGQMVANNPETQWEMPSRATLAFPMEVAAP